MKTTTILLLATGIISFGSLTASAAPPVIVVQPTPPPLVAPPPPPATPAPAPGIAVTIGVPDSYVWDGAEYVGLIGDQYYYLGPNDEWLPMPPARLDYFHHWERHHRDWLKRAIRNERYRRDAHGHDYPWHDHHDHDYDHDGH